VDMSKYAGSESKYLKASDLQGKRVRVEIAGVSLLEFDDEETGGKEHKPAVDLKGKEKKLVLNATNTNEIMRVHGAESDGWIGKTIELSTKYYKSFGKEGIVVQAISGDNDFDDDIPF